MHNELFQEFNYVLGTVSPRISGVGQSFRISIFLLFVFTLSPKHDLQFFQECNPHNLSYLITLLSDTYSFH